jgi:predicted anti-sigma-YlaC factor YlaD
MTLKRDLGMRGVTLALVLLLPAVSCSIRKMAVNTLADSLASGADVFLTDDDPELIRDAMPFALKTIEALIEEAPDNRGLIVAACRGFAGYAYFFVQTDADLLVYDDYRAARAGRERALRLYLRARDYGLRALELGHPGVTDRLRTDPGAALADVKADEVAALYWAGASWGLAISHGKNRPDLLADIDAVRALLGRALELEPGFENGMIYQAMILIDSLPEYMGGSVDRAREDLERAVELSGGHQAAPWVSFAESVSVMNQDREEFEAMLDAALAVDLDAAPEQRLANVIAQRRARFLRDNADELFLEPLDAPDEEDPA